MKRPRQPVPPAEKTLIALATDVEVLAANLRASIEAGTMPVTREHLQQLIGLCNAIARTLDHLWRKTSQ